MVQASVGFHCPECAKRGAQKVYSGPAALQFRPVATMVLIAVNVAVFVYAFLVDGGNSLGGQIGELHLDYALIGSLDPRVPLGVGHGEWYRMITSGFLHYGIIHIALNMYALWILGGAVERMAGRTRMVLAYFFSILAGSLGALIIDPGSITAGASGGVFGLMGTVLIVQRMQGVAFRDSPLIGVLAFNLIFTFGVSGISVGGHIGGLVGGALAGWLLSIPQLRQVHKLLGPALIVVAGLGLIALGIGISAV